MSNEDTEQLMKVAELATNTTNSTASYPVVLNDYYLLLIGFLWIAFCYLLFQFVRKCTRPAKGANKEISDEGINK